MAKVVAVHGIGQQHEGPDSQAQQWVPALRDGMTLAGASPVDAGDMVVAFYGEVFRSSGKKAFGEIELTAADVDDFELELLTEWADAVVALEGGDPGQPAMKTKMRTPEVAQRALSVLSRSRFFAKAADRVTIWNLRQVRSYLTEPATRAEIRARVEAAVGPDTRVVIGHSLGSVVAYEALAAHPEWSVRAFVTLGSPLGIRRLVFDRLQPAPKDGRGAWPGTIGAWTNVCDKGDAVALAKQLRPLFDDRIADVLVDNGAKAHDVRPYLTAKQTGSAIAAGLAS